MAEDYSKKTADNARRLADIRRSRARKPVKTEETEPSKKYLIGGSSDSPVGGGQPTGESDGDWFSDIINQPIVKGIINVLSTGAYTAGNIMNPTAERNAKLNELRESGASEQEIANATADIYNPLNIVGDVIGGVGKGLSAGIGQNPNDAVLPSKALRKSVGKEGTDLSNPLEFSAGLAADILLDPLTYVGFGAAGAAMRGSVAGARDAGIASRMAAKGAEVTGKPTKRLEGAVEGAKNEMAARRAKIQDEKANRQRKRDLKRRGVSAGTIDEFGIKTSTSLPEKLAAGNIGEATARDMKSAADRSNAVDEAVIQAETPEEAADLIRQIFDEPLDLNSMTNAVKSFGEQAMKPEAVKAAERVGKRKPRITQPRTMEDAVATERVNTAGKPDMNTITPAKLIDENAPVARKEADYSHFTPVDRFIYGTEFLSAYTAKYSTLKANRIRKYVEEHPTTLKTETSPAVLDVEKLVGALSKQRPTTVSMKENSFLRGFKMRNNRVAPVEHVTKTIRDAASPLAAKGASKAEIAAVVSKALSEKYKSMPDLSAFTAEKAKYSYTPDPVGLSIDELRKIGLDESDFPALMSGELDTLIKPTGDWNKIFAALEKGEIDPADSEKFLDFMRAFGENPSMTLEQAIAGARQFVEKNAEAIKKSEKVFSQTSEAGRLRIGTRRAPNGSVYLMRLLPPETAGQFRKPFAPAQAQDWLAEQADVIDGQIINGIEAAETARIADEAIVKHFSEYITPLGEFRTARNASTATPDPLTGGAKWEHLWTSHAAINMFNDVNRMVSASLKGKVKTRGDKAYFAARDDMMMRVLAKMDNTLKGYGIFPVLTNLMPKGAHSIRLSLYDVFDALGPELRLKLVHTAKNDMNNLLPTQILDMAEHFMRSVIRTGSDGSDLAVLRPEMIQILKGNFETMADSLGINREIQKSLALNHTAFNDKIIQAAVESGQKLQNATKNRAAAYRRTFDAFIKANDMGESVVSRLAEKALRNSQLNSSLMSRGIVSAGQESIKRLQTAISTGTVGSTSRMIAEFVPPINKMEPEASVLNRKVHDEILSTIATPRERIAADASNKTAKISNDTPSIFSVGADGAVTAPKVTTAKARATQEAAKAMRQQKLNAANREFSERVGNPNLHPDRLNDSNVLENGTDGLFSLMQHDLAWEAATRLNGISRLFNRDFGMKHSYPVVSSGIHTVTHLETAFYTGLNELAKKHMPEAIKQGFLRVRDFDGDMLKFINENPNHTFSAADVDMAKLVNNLFDPDKNNFFARNGVGVDHLNSILKTMRHVPEEWQFKGDSPVDIVNSWKEWPIADPLRAMAAVHTAMVKASMDISMGAQYSRHFGSKVPVVDGTKLYKLDPKAIGDNAFARLIDKDLYYPREILEELPALGRLITESRTFKSDFMNRWSSEVFDPFISALKMTQTTMKPGHHVMSVQGDLLRNSLAGMNFKIGPYKDMWRILRTRHAAIKELSGLDEWIRIKDNGANIMIGSAAKSSDNLTVDFGKGPMQISYDSIYKAMEQRDIILPVHSTGVAEDLLSPDGGRFLDDAVEEGGGMFYKGMSTASKGLHKTVTKLGNNRLVKLNKFTAERDNLMRGALALHFMQSKKFKSFEDAMDYASSQVRKWAPTARDLTAAESKVNRRIMFYYTWQRGILPRVAEMALERPGWALMPSKTMYNIALANGVNPASLGDPFPEDGLFPEYYRKGVLGPQWITDDGDYWGLNPTSPLMDTMNSLGSGASLKGIVTGEAQGDLFKTLMGMTNPVFRGPVELGLGESVSTGAPIDDTGQYLTDMIGPARYLSKVTGHTISPSVEPVGLTPRRTEAKYRGGIGDSDDWLKNLIPESANYGTGMQFRNYTSEAATKNAEFTEKEKLRQEQRRNTRYGVGE